MPRARDEKSKYGRIADSRQARHMRLAILGGGTIARLVMETLRKGTLPGVEVLAIAGRSARSGGAALAAEFGARYVVGADALLAAKPEVVLEAASHDAVRAHLVTMLASGTSVIVLSAGALADDALRVAAERAARVSGALLYVPSGGIGGLDALKAACAAGVDEVSIRVAKPPAAWKKIPFVEALGVDLDALDAAVTLFDGPARSGVPHFPQNVNIAAVLSLAGIGFDRTRLEVVADPDLTRNTHTIRVAGKTGRFTVVLENVPAPENPKTAWLACYSALAALREFGARARYGT
jgi:aspartate dehydrogenase